MPIVPSLGRQRQEHYQKPNDSLMYTVRACLKEKEKERREKVRKRKRQRNGVKRWREERGNRRRRRRKEGEEKKKERDGRKKGIKNNKVRMNNKMNIVFLWLLRMGELK